MSGEIEAGFVRSVFRKEFRDRLCHELLSPKKRDSFFDKIAHNCEDYIRSDVVIKRSDMPLSEKEILAFLNTKDGVSVIAYRSELDGRCIDLDAALSELSSNGSPFVIIAPAERKAYLETEYDFSVHTSYLIEY